MYNMYVHFMHISDNSNASGCYYNFYKVNCLNTKILSKTVGDYDVTHSVCQDSVSFLAGKVT